ncbi:MAG: hypothetical protein A3F72_05320 [Bacteroidetes bacterium RIFCSPLOWO2_12_FULL_35_15]|nr:MAG: hypothetical protein A3F72_05320 [Bacteroidetes bacterium RIFCSPLOWO2_12_FULL_35_15]
MKTKIISLLIVGIIGFSSCAKQCLLNGNRAYDAAAYKSAITNYEKYLTKKSSNEVKIKLANSYRLSNDYKNAEILYAEVVTFPEAEHVEMFNYAKVLMNQGRYDEAKIWLTKYLKVKNDDFAAEMLLVSCNNVNKLKEDTTLFTLKEVHIPDVSTAFGGTKYGDGIVFTADKEIKNATKKSGWTGRSYYDLYYSKKGSDGNWESPQVLKGEINGEYHEGAATFNKAGDVVYFTRSNYFTKHKLAKTSKNESNLKVFRAELVNGKWTNLEELPFNSDDYSCGHPTLSADEKSLYFISDMPGGLGGTDIYKTTLMGGTDIPPLVQSGPASETMAEKIYSNSTWSKPENLGPAVNTIGNEMFPSIAADGTIYFSSDANNNLGGLDVFATTCSATKCLAPENLGYPLNSSKDDFGYNLNEDNKTGFVSSNRTGEDKMYDVIKNDPTFILTGTVTLKADNTPIENAIIEHVNAETNMIDRTTSGKDGKYTLHLTTDSEYKTRSLKEGYFTLSNPVNTTTKGKKKSETFTANFVLDKLVIEKPIVMENIYYDFDKWFIRPDAGLELDKLVTILKDNPKISIELSSHCDSRGSDEYNLVLSDKRAKAAVEYMITKGIDANRMKWKGYGETKHVNGCSNGVECTDEEHQKNRRTEFKVTKISN